MNEKFGQQPQKQPEQDIRSQYRKDVEEMEAYRKSEVIENLERFVDIFELSSYFGEGQSIKERIKSGINNPDFWSVFLFLDEKSVTKIAEAIVKRFGENCELGNIRDLSQSYCDRDDDSDGSKYVKFDHAFIIEPTIRGFSVNASAYSYKTKFLIKIEFPVKNEIKAGDLPGDQKYLPFEPSYVSTPSIHAWMRETVMSKGDDFITFNCDFVSW